MRTFIITGYQTRTDGVERKRRFVVNAESREVARKLASSYAEGYYQYGPLTDIHTYEVAPNNIRSFDEFSPD